MITDPLEPFYVHEIIVKPYLRKDGYGRDLYGPEKTVRVYVDDKRRLVRGADGQEVVSETQVAGKLADLRDVSTGSRITLPPAYGRRTTTVLAVSVGDMAGAMGFPEHVELSLA